VPNDACRAAAQAAAHGAARTTVALAYRHDPDLPITAQREQIMDALRRHQVLIVAGDTGSGKSTQLPQYCLELGRGTLGLIAHTQPRRLAARALASRIAEELGQSPGATVGFRVRFADRVSAATRLVMMTDGLLLAELTTDPLLRRYDTIIVDEAHERTLNIDLLLGVLKQLLPRRPELKLIVTSATLDVERMARFFDDAPIATVNGRNHPIEVRYAAAADNAEDPDLPAAVLQAYRDIAAAPGAGAGDVLVFLPGEREIRDVGDYLERELDSAEVLALYSRLPWEQQSRIFQRGQRRRIVLATNVAETSITVPGIRSVIDSGLARVSRYSPRNRLQRLLIEPVSRASAEQRKGRCGRLGPGLCIRLYSQADFEARPAFTEPEVLRTNLAALLLRLGADGLGDAERFPFIDAPDARALGDGYRVLQELQAFDTERRITRMGRAMARLPLDPRLARALLESKRFHAQAEVLAIVAGLSVPDPSTAGSARAGEQPSAAAAFEDGKSEFSALVKLWRAYRKAREGPRRELRRWCRERGLSLLRLSEWDDVHAQVEGRAAELGLVAQPRAASYTGVHRALLSGFCTMVGARGEEGVYRGVRGVQFHIFPGSPLKRRKPRWVMAANIVETSRVFARRVAEVQPLWIEAAARHLSKREFVQPDWDVEREQVVARERVSFLGLTLSDHRVVNYGPIAPEESRLIFAREALVHQRLQRRPEWVTVNDEVIAAAQRLEDRLRTRDLLRAPEFFVEFYDRALPRQVSSAATLEHFSRHLTGEQRARLTLQPTDVVARSPDADLLAQFPERVSLPAPAVEAVVRAGIAHAGPLQVAAAVEYRFAPGEAGDGATLRIPLLALPTMTRAIVDAAVPGLARPRVEALLRSLPKEARRELIPIGAAAASFIEFMGAPSTDEGRLADWLKDHRGVPQALIRFDAAAVPAHLKLQLEVTAATSAITPDRQPAVRGQPAFGALVGGQRAGRVAAAFDITAATPKAGHRAPATGAMAGGERAGRDDPPFAITSGTPTAARDRPASAAIASGQRAERGDPASGTDLGVMRRRFAAQARELLDRRAQLDHPGAWRRFECESLDETAVIDTEHGAVQVYPTLRRCGNAVELRYEWSPEEAAHWLQQGAACLARLVLERQARDLAKFIAADTQLLLAASPYVGGDALHDGLLQLVFGQACFGEGIPRTRAAFDAAIDRGRERLQTVAEETTAAARRWFTSALAVRRLLEDPRARRHAGLAESTGGHLLHLLDVERIADWSMDWSRQLPRYLRAEECRWQRLLTRGTEPADIARELRDWGERVRHLELKVAAELRWLPQLDELHVWIEEYRISLYAQELRTQGPVSNARLMKRVAQIESWITR
jgi:ATP-dependent helicase HrpA